MKPLIPVGVPKILNKSIGRIMARPVIDIQFIMKTIFWGSNDLPDNFVEDHALQVVELNHDYELAKLSDSSSDAPNGSPNAY